MSTGFNLDLIRTEYESKNKIMQTYLDDIRTIIVNSNACLEGNCFYHHQTLHLYGDLFSKQLNLFWCGKQGITRMCEIGFNAGHSTMLMLLGRDQTPIDYTIFDIGHHPYTRPTVEYIKNKFNHINFEYVEGDSTVVMPQWINMHPTLVETYDVVHVDGGHNEHCISNDMINADKLVKKGGLVIIDDTNDAIINKYVDMYLSNGKYVEVRLLPSYGYPHRIIRKVE